MLLLQLLLSHFSRVRLCATPWTAAHQAPPVPGILQARTLEWVAISFSSFTAPPNCKGRGNVSPSYAQCPEGELAVAEHQESPPCPASLFAQQVSLPDSPI